MNYNSTCETNNRIKAKDQKLTWELKIETNMGTKDRN
jgi:hypothetical protein